MKLTPSDAKRITDAVAHAESGTSLEIVVVIRPHSGNYADVALLAGAAASFVALTFVVFTEIEIDPHWVVPICAVAFALVTLAITLLAPTVFTRAARRKRHVDDAAHAEFARARLFS